VKNLISHGFTCQSPVKMKMAQFILSKVHCAADIEDSALMQGQDITLEKMLEKI